MPRRGGCDGERRVRIGRRRTADDVQRCESHSTGGIEIRCVDRRRHPERRPTGAVIDEEIPGRQIHAEVQRAVQIHRRRDTGLIQLQTQTRYLQPQWNRRRDRRMHADRKSQLIPHQRRRHAAQVCFRRIFRPHLIHIRERTHLIDQPIVQGRRQIQHRPQPGANDRNLNPQQIRTLIDVCRPGGERIDARAELCAGELTQTLVGCERRIGCQG